MVILHKSWGNGDVQAVNLRPHCMSRQISPPRGKDQKYYISLNDLIGWVTIYIVCVSIKL